jgi:hypothetical protein
MNQNTADIPIACQRLAGVFSPEAKVRHAEIWNNIEGKIQGIIELKTGYAFNFPMEDELFQELAEYITYERHCCPFFRFALELEPGAEMVSLRLTGGDGVKEFLTNELASYKKTFDL